MLEILEDRCGNRATIMTSQVDPKHWHQLLGDPTVADAIVDRVLHRAHKIVLKGPQQAQDCREMRTFFLSVPEDYSQVRECYGADSPPF